MAFRSAIIGAVIAIVTITSTVTFGASLRALVSHPASYGWNWNYELLSGFAGDEDLPAPQVSKLLHDDPYVTVWTGIYFGGATVDGHTVPIIGTSVDAEVAPPLLTGHGLDVPGQIVLGPSTLAQLHKRVGDSVEVNAGSSRPTELRIVGVATMPTIGQSGNAHPTMGTGALIDYHLVPAAQRNVQGNPVPGPNAVLIRVRTTNSSAALESLQRIERQINQSTNGAAGGVVGVLHPAQIADARAMQTTPTALGTGLALGATVALGLILVASVRQRRHELAILKTLGFTRRQLATVVGYQGSIATMAGLVIGLPVGIVVGRTLWIRFAESIHAVPHPTVPTTVLALVAVAALLLSIVAATLPALRAASVEPARFLRTE